MRNDKFMNELLCRLQYSNSDDIIGSIASGIITDSEAARDAILCVMDMLGLREFISIEEHLESGILHYHIVFDVDGSYTPDDLDGKKYIVRFLCGDHEVDKQGYDNAHDACVTAVAFDSEEGCDYAAVYRLTEDGTYEEILWCNTSCDFGNDLDEDDPDYDTIEEAFAWAEFE